MTPSGVRLPMQWGIRVRNETRLRVSQLLNLRLQAGSGDPRAQLQLARMMLIGREAPFAPDEAMRLVVAACEKKYDQALLFHATLAALGLARPQSFDEAIQLVAQAAATGSGRAKGQLLALGGLKGFDIQAWSAKPDMVQHFDAPRVFTIRNFLPPPACAWLISQTRKRREEARVKDPNVGKGAANQIRTNTGAGFSMIEPDLVMQLTNLRIAAATGVPFIHQEPTNVLHYAVGQEYKAHFDFITETEAHAFTGELDRLGQRVATFLIYLNEGYEGGETAFPHLDWRYKGQTGDALLFWNVSTAGELERNSLHAGTPVTKGEKWLLSKWIRAKPHPLI